MTVYRTRPAGVRRSRALLAAVVTAGAGVALIVLAGLLWAAGSG